MCIHICWWVLYNQIITCSINFTLNVQKMLECILYIRQTERKTEIVSLIQRKSCLSQSGMTWHDFRWKLNSVIQKQVIWDWLFQYCSVMMGGYENWRKWFIHVNMFLKSLKRHTSDLCKFLHYHRFYISFKQDKYYYICIVYIIHKLYLEHSIYFVLKDCKRTVYLIHTSYLSVMQPCQVDIKATI